MDASPSAAGRRSAARANITVPEPAAHDTCWPCAAGLYPCCADPDDAAVHLPPPCGCAHRPFALFPAHGYRMGMSARWMIVDGAVQRRGAARSKGAFVRCGRSQREAGEAAETTRDKRQTSMRPRLTHHFRITEKTHLFGRASRMALWPKPQGCVPCAPHRVLRFCGTPQ